MTIVAPLTGSRAAAPVDGPDYRFRLSEDGATIYLDGNFEHGMTADLTALLARNDAVAEIVLASEGGNIFEGRGVAGLIEAHGLDTFVKRTCASACTRAFIAGRNRTLARGGRLGFHAYRLDANYPLPFVDIAGEQERDRAFFRARKVKEAFLNLMFAIDGPELWIPSPETLLAAGVATRIEASPARR